MLDDYDELEEDVFVGKPGHDKQQFGAVGSKEA